MDLMKFLVFLALSFPMLGGAQYLTNNYNKKRYGAVIFMTGVVLALAGIFLFYEAISHFYADYKARPSA